MDEYQQYAMTVSPATTPKNWFYALIIGSTLLQLGYCLWYGEWKAIGLLMAWMISASCVMSAPALILLALVVRDLNRRKLSFGRYVVWFQSLHAAIALLSTAALVWFKPFGFLLSNNNIYLIVGSYFIVGVLCWTATFRKHRKRPQA